MHFRDAVIKLFNLDGLKIFAYSGWPEVASDVIFDESVEEAEVDLMCKFRAPS